MSLPENLEKLRKEFKLNRDDFWEVRRGTWAITHKACEKIEDAIKVEWQPPQLIETDSASAVSMIVFGTVGNVTKWATGEASPKNNKNAYPWAMAEKRAKDRVIIKLAGVSGDLYSDSEADDFKKPEPKPTPRGEVSALDQGDRTNREIKATYDKLLTSLNLCRTSEDLSDWKNMFSDEYKDLPEDYRESMRGECARKKGEIEALMVTV
jgi:hypothetical protein